MITGIVIGLVTRVIIEIARAHFYITGEINMDNEELYDAALEAIQKLFGDTTVSKSHTREQLESLQGEIETMLDTIDD